MSNKDTKEKANFMQVGQTIECGHCNSKYEEGLKLTIKAIPNYVCECKCHSPHPNWETEFNKRFGFGVWDSRAESNFGKTHREEGIFSSDVVEFICSTLHSQLEELAEKIKRYQKKFEHIDKRTGEIEFRGGRQCRNCNKRLDDIELVEVLSTIEQMK